MKILDHGYVRFVEAWGYGDAKISEAGIIEAARQSTQGTFRGWETDIVLLKFLQENKHDSPFEFAGMVIEVQAPIFVFREWHRHRTQSYNEMSARYEPVPDFNYVPSYESMFIKQKGNKQAGAVKGAKELTQENAVRWRDKVELYYTEGQNLYQEGLYYGVKKEQARIVMPVGRYSRMRASANLRNWIAFLTLRQDPAAQWEIRQYADAVASIIAEQFPKTYGLFADKREKASKFKNLLFKLKEFTLGDSPTLKEDLIKALEEYGI